VFILSLTTSLYQLPPPEGRGLLKALPAIHPPPVKEGVSLLRTDETHFQNKILVLVSIWKIYMLGSPSSSIFIWHELLF